MNDYTFTIRFAIQSEDLDSLSVRVYDRIEDASLMGPDDDGTFLIEFDREAPEFAPVVAGALDELRAVLPDAVILRVEGDDLATMADIAKRTGRSDESIRLLIQGKRGAGDFPPAAGRLDARTRVWRWADIAPWFADVLGEPLPGAEGSAFIQALNDALDLARLSDRLARDERAAVATVLPLALAPVAA
jgi:hypothetical protein